MTENEPEGVKSVAKALELLRLLSEYDDGVRASALARMAGFAVSTTHRLLTTLQTQGFAYCSGETMTWHVGREAFAVGSAYGRRRNFVAPALPFLRRLRDQTRETANLGLLDRDQLVTVSQVESREIIRAISPPGGSAPVFCSGMGKAILATWTDQAIVALAERTGFHPLTRRSLRSIDTLLAEMHKTRDRGFALDDEEHVTGLRCVASVIWTPHREAACAISVSGLAARLSDDRLPDYADAVCSAAMDMTCHLGGQVAGAPPVG